MRGLPNRLVSYEIRAAQLLFFNAQSCRPGSLPNYYEGDRLKMRPIADNLFAEGKDGPVLIGGAHRVDGTFCFPYPTGPDAVYFEQISLPQTGTLWSYTVQRFRPKPPYNDGCSEGEPYVPFALGYVELQHHIVVEARLVVSDFKDLQIGIPMRLVLAPLRVDPDGEAVMTYAFTPATVDTLRQRVGEEA